MNVILETCLNLMSMLLLHVCKVLFKPKGESSMVLFLCCTIFLQYSSRN